MNPLLRWSYLFAVLIFPVSVIASPRCESGVAIVVSSQGRVDYQPFNYYEWKRVKNGDVFCYGDKVRTASNSRVTLSLSNGSVATLDQNTTLAFNAPEEKNTNWIIKIFSGSSFFRSRYPQKLNIRTPFINAVHEGTEFLVDVSSKDAKISVFDGMIAAENQYGNIKINKGAAVVATKNSPPSLQVLTVRPEDAVQWTLYYPPIIDYPNWEQDENSPLREVIDHYRKGDINKALTKLDKVKISSRNSRYWIIKASIFLSVGRVDEARKAIGKVLQRDVEYSQACALKAIIAVAKNRQQDALNLAEKSVADNKQSVMAQLALSYAYQSLQKIDQAEMAAQAAVRLSPDNALAWVRLAELQLSLGDHSAALASAQKAYELDPSLARTQTILGFAELADIDIDKAKHNFERAVSLDAGDPIARLGLGLVKIRKGDVEEGSRDLEVAVSLDPNNSVARSYLGKAYYELRNAEYAGAEFAIAKEMDPKDPTPWFYDAILKQSVNKPIEALKSMEKAVDLNDNRGVYRSELLLDEDAAARTANLARMYNDLGFGRVALKQAWKSLGHDSSNYSAHRFLADSYIGKPRFRIARASELLRARLLQPVNITPVQPQLTAENIGILNSLGPSSLSVNEYDPMFTSNGAHAWLNGAYGSNNTLTDNAIVSGVYDNLSLSMGQFHFQTDGFRANDDYQQDIYNAFAQYSFNQDLSIQVEFKSDDVRAGDVPFRLNGFQQENFRQTIEHDTVRTGGHYRIDSEQDLIVSAFYTTRKDIINDHVFNTVDPNPFLHFNTKQLNLSKDKGYQAELQYLFHQDRFDVTSGFGYLGLDRNLFFENIARWTVPPVDIIPSLTNSLTRNRQLDFFNAYIYSKQKILPSLTTTLGVSFDYFDNDLSNKSRLNPKFGVLWTPLSDLTLRGAILRTMNRPLAAGQTIEPTQVAGFNQFYDGTNGELSWQYSLGLDYSFSKEVFLGGMLNWRDIKEPIVFGGSQIQRKKTEASHLAYLYWMPLDWFAFKSEYHYKKSNREFIVGNVNNIYPQSLTTQHIPLSVSLYHNSGLSAKFGVNYVNQKVAMVNGNITGNPLTHDKEKFWTFDSSLSYRFPKKIGVISLQARNLFDNNFKYQSAFDASGPQLSTFVPEREFFVKLSLFY